MSITLQPPSSAAYNAGDVLTFTLVSADPITIEPAGPPVELSLVIGTTSRVALLDVAASTATHIVFTYTVQAGDNDSDGVAVGDLVDPDGRLYDSATFQSVSFNANGAIQAGVVVDTTAPTATLDAPANGTRVAGDVISLALDLDEAVTIGNGVDPVTLALTVGSQARTATLNESASTATRLVFEYTVQSGDNDADGIVVGALSDVGGRVADGAGNALTFAGGSTLANVTVDAVAPTATLDSATSGTRVAGDVISLALNLDEAVTVANGSDPITLALTVGSQARTATLNESASTATHLVFEYTVQAGDNDADGIAVGALSDVGGRVTDAAGNALTFTGGSTLANVTVDALAPTATLGAPADGARGIGEVLTFTLDTSEAVTIGAGADPVGLELTIGSQARTATLDAGASTATQLVFTYTVQAGDLDSDGIVVGALSDAGGRVADAAGNALTFTGGSTLANVTVDTVAPTATLDAPANGVRVAGEVLSFALALDEAVTIANGSDPVTLALTIGGQARTATLNESASTATHLVFDYTVQAGDLDSDGIAVGALSDAGGRVADAAGNALTFTGGSTLANVTVDAVAPSATLDSAASGTRVAGNVISLALDLDEAVTIANAVDPVTLALTVGSQARTATLNESASTATRLVFEYTVQTGDLDSDGIVVGALSDAGGRVADAAGNALTFTGGSTLANVTVDTVAPTATLDAPANGVRVAGEVLSFALALDEAVTIANGSDPVTLALTIGGQARTATLNESASTATRLVFEYTVQSGDNDADGIAVGALSDAGGRVADAAGNALTFTGGSTLAGVTVDAVVPTATLGAPADGARGAGEVLTFTLDTSEAVTIGAGADPVGLELTIGSQARTATLDAGASTATQLVFTYTVQAGDSDADGIAVGALSDAGGRVKDAAGNALTFTGGSTLANVTVDGNAPTATLGAPADGLRVAGDVLSFTLDTSEAVSIHTGADPITLALTVGSQARTATLDTGASTATQLVFTYTVQAGDLDSDGIVVGALSDAGGRVADAAGNALTFTGGATLANVTVDALAPTATLDTVANGLRGPGNILVFALNLSE
ncbi:MAG: hypothetical protein K2X11_00725, partial [Acetobacteraceae bacterium]|nr:hypothetical protein [Acetobacteraceae bacterium]